MEDITTFTFGILVYNHSEYILEHLESIKYQKVTFGESINVRLVISDDGSNDNTIELVNTWLDINKSLFSDIVFLSDGVNRGVGYSFTRIWEYIGNEPFKILAGDDLYSYENIFSEASLLEYYDFVSGLPLLLIEGKLIRKNSLFFNMYATQHIYEDKSLLSKIKNISVINTPSLLYRNKYIQDKSVSTFIRKFRVTEDFPMMASLSSKFNNVSFYTSSKVHIYYRRTSGSIYLVENERYNKDKEDIFLYLLDVDNKWIGKLLTRNRLYCYKKGGISGKLFNIGYYLYILRVLIKLPLILMSLRKLSIDEVKHRLYYAKIVKQAKSVESVTINRG